MQTPPPESKSDNGQPLTFSQSSLQDYADCPRRYQLRYLDRLMWPAVEAEPVSETEARQREALLFHRLVQQHLMGLQVSKLAAMATSPDLARWWHNYASAGPDLSGHTLHTERTLAARVGEHRLVSKYDLLAVGDGRAMIYDWKTYARRPRDEWLAARWQTRVYRAMLVTAGADLNGGEMFEPGAISMFYWFAEFPSEPAQFVYDPQQFKRDWSAIENLVKEITHAQVFPLTEDRTRCRFCVYRSLCDRGGEAGAWQEAEAGASESTEFELDFEQIGEIEI
ncbi:MAG: PD-(D/E)XK nuclease family protein [Chloroflexota bacterium]